MVVEVVVSAAAVGFHGGGFRGGGFHGGGFRGGGAAFHGGGFRGGGAAFHGGGFRGGGVAIHVAAFVPRPCSAAAACATDIATSITGRTSITTGITSIGVYYAPAYYGYPYYYGYRHRYCRVIWTYYGPRKICSYRPWIGTTGAPLLRIPVLVRSG